MCILGKHSTAGQHPQLQHKDSNYTEGSGLWEHIGFSVLVDVRFPFANSSISVCCTFVELAWRYLGKAGA